MRSEPRRQVETLFHAACGRAAGAERAAYLDGACGTDLDLRARVDALLAAHDEAAEFLESPAVEGTREGPGSSIGPYKLLQEIGEGGMGVVYMAEQQQPVRRKVAVKVIKLGMDTKQVIARFEAERQALALMDHPHIARVLDAGSTEAGRPFFVMELVRGVPMNEYCDTHKLATEERLRLFVEVCRAVQHAHQKGIIHRDLKPTNVLITSHDGTPVPKIIDFGVAKATNQNLTERTLFTEYRQIIGTPEYMSPEQAEMSGLDVDTRSDIYALGVMLYQLLTGTTPVDAAELRTAGYEEMTRMIREDEPPAPSTRISKLGADGAKVAAHRGTDVGALSRHFRGDLDWIVMRALEKDRTRRYETASAFAKDIERHLSDQPVEAGPPGAAYRVRKFLHRHRKASVAGLALLVVIGLGLAGTSAGFLRAQSEAARSGRVSATLQDVLAMTDPARSGDLDALLETVREVFGEDDATEAAVLDTLANRLHDAGDFDAAEPLYRESLAISEQVYGGTHMNVAITRARLGKLLRARGNDGEAEGELRAALMTFGRASDAPDLARHDARVELADLLSNLGEFEEAEALLRDSLAALRASPSPRHFRVLETLEKLLMLQLQISRDDARATLHEIYDEAHAFYPETSPVLAVAAWGLGNFLVQDSDYSGAEPYLREAIERFLSCEAPPEIYLLGARESLFQVLRRSSDPERLLEADEVLRATIEGARPFWGPDALAGNLSFYAGRMLERDAPAEALEAALGAHQAFVDGGRSLADREPLRDQLTYVSFKVALRSDLAQDVYANALDAIELILADEPTHPAMIVVRGGLLYRLGRFEDAAETLARVPDPLSNSRSGLARKVAPSDHVFRALTQAQLGHTDVARAELAKLHELLGDNEPGAEIGALLREIEAQLEHTSSESDG